MSISDKKTGKVEDIKKALRDEGELRMENGD